MAECTSVRRVAPPAIERCTSSRESTPSGKFAVRQLWTIFEPGRSSSVVPWR